jgi:hypothetical protein
MKADCVPPSAFHARTTSAATSGVHLGCHAATNHAGSALVVVAVLVVIVPRTVRDTAHHDYLGRTGALRSKRRDLDWAGLLLRTFA